jgi:hypothetical protein
MSNFLSLVAGSIISIVVTYLSYWRSSKDLMRESEMLRKEAEKLRKLQELTIYALTNRNADLEPTRDAAGNITGLTVMATGRSAGMASGRAEMTLTPAPGGPKKGQT